MSLHVGDLEVWESGTVLTHGGHPVRFELPTDPPLEVVLLFREPGEGAPRLEASQTDGRLDLTLVDFARPEGYGTLEPIAVTDHLRFSFRVYAAGSDPGAKVVHYTWLLDPGESPAAGRSG